MPDQPVTVRCLNCETIVLASPRHLVGCTCDPDAPTWVFILPGGEIRGGSHSRWERLS